MAEKISIIGAGLVGSLLALNLKKLGFEITVYEKRADLRKSEIGKGRSINLALSTRGLYALSKVGLEKEVLKMALPMYGRYIHIFNEDVHFTPYSIINEKAIYSISRNQLNQLLINEAEKSGVKFHFQHNLTKVDFNSNILGFRNESNEYIKVTPEICFGTDGAYSELRNEMIQNDAFNFSQEFLEYGYKEIDLPASELGKWKLPNNGLHIWPRKDFMLIALPNLNGSFTCTLFLKMKGDESFEMISESEVFNDFFKKYFPDAYQCIPDLWNQFLSNPIGKLVTIKCFPYLKINEESIYYLLGDAAHAIVPFYGQGMNCGFEDVSQLTDMLSEIKLFNWVELFNGHQQKRKPNCDAIAQMALDNFVEMRDLVSDIEFIKNKHIESQLKQSFPDLWQTQYELVTFSNENYTQALKQGLINKKLVDHIRTEKIQVEKITKQELKSLFKLLSY
ncbi:MAG: NAD(P)/FAD-dependent oxidoreductase [Bacteroidota bacterium]|nr:NAD(P)/FAD-dependent oxidoreductase [Bacteroidota bacterium]